MLKVFSAGNLQDAYLIQSLLNEAGIETKILNEFAQGGSGEIPFTQAYPEIWLINENDETKARKIISSFEQRPNSVGTCMCSKCGESNPDTFEICWRCGNNLKVSLHE